MAEIKTLCDLYFHTIENLARPDHLLRKRKGLWEVVSTQEIAETVEAFSCGLMALGVKPGDKVVLISEDRPKWLLTDYAVLTAGAADVPIYPTLNAQETAYIANNSDAEVAVVSNEDQANKLLSQRENLKRLKSIVVFDPPTDGHPDLLTWDQVIAWGKDYAAKNPGIHRKVASQVKPEDLATLIYTSGTTGVPKGVMLTHSNFVENCRAGMEYLEIDATDRALVFLPLSHSLERMIDYCYFWQGLSIAYAESIEKVADNLGEVKPTCMAAVPRLYEKVYARLMEQAAQSSALKKFLIHWSIRTVSEWAETYKANKGKVPMGLAFRRALADKIVPKKLRARVGGRIRFFVSGGAPLPRHLAVFFYGCGLPIAEGYGLTETTPVVSVNEFHKDGRENIRFGSPGRPLKNVEVRIAEDGELWVRGPNVMKGYYKMPKETEEVLTPDGWFATGDIATLDEDGFLFITDRKKELIVTAGGKNVAPQPIENELKCNKYVTQAVLIGDRRPYITALIVPNFDNVIEYCKSKGVNKIDPRDLCREPVVAHLFQNVLDRVNANLSRYEQIKKCRLLPKELTMEEGELTPTLKVKRRVINQKYGHLIEEMYAENGNGSKK
ncbi:MAG: AMP-dependent synthetase/ligase [Acidobacteriota bacterium]